MNKIKFYKHITDNGHCDFFHESDEKRKQTYLDRLTTIAVIIFVTFVGCCLFKILFLSDVLGDIFIWSYKFFKGGL